jgi:hypothetical protein
MIFFNLPNPSGRTGPCGLLSLRISQLYNEREMYGPNFLTFGVKQQRGH